MSRIGRSFPTHTEVAIAGLSSYQVTLTASANSAILLQRGPVRTLSIASPISSVVNAIKLKSLNVLSVVSATSSTLSNIKGVGKGVFLAVTSPTVNVLSRALRKWVNLGNLPSNTVYQRDVMSSNANQYWQFTEIGGNGNVFYDSMLQFFMTTGGGTTKGVGDLIGGSVGSSVSFDGVSGSGASGTNLVNFQNHDFTVEFWMYPFATNSNGFPFAVGTTDFASQGDAFLHIGFTGSTKKLKFGFFGDDLDSVTLFNPYTLYHIACTWQASTKQKVIYVNGVQDVSGISSGALNVPNSASQQIAKVTFTTGANGPFFYNGVLAHLATYPSVLSATDVARHYQEGTTGVPYTATSQNQALSPVPSITKFVDKFIGSALNLASRFITRSRVVVNNFDGGIVVPLTTTVLNQTPKPFVLPGLFKVVPPKGTLKIQFKPFSLKIVKRVQIQ